MFEGEGKTALRKEEGEQGGHVSLLQIPWLDCREIAPLEEFSLPSEAEGEGNFREAAEGTGNSVDGWL